MSEDLVILIAEDDPGHASLIKKNLKRSGVTNQIIHFKDGEKILNFLFKKGDPPYLREDTPYLILLDIRMPKIDGVEVLRRIKEDEKLKKIPVTMLTTTDDPREIDRCHGLGCGNYIVKPVDYQKFVETVKQLGVIISVVKVPTIGGGN